MPKLWLVKVIRNNRDDRQTQTDEFEDMKLESQVMRNELTAHREREENTENHLPREDKEKESSDDKDVS